MDKKSSSSIVAVTNQRRNPFEGIKLENPFSFKVLQVFTGFGIGCGVGIGVGGPLNLASIPVVNQVMSAGREAVYAVSGVNRHVNDALRKMGAKNVQAGIGCGVGFGHGFGIGFGIKPSAMHQIQFFVTEAATKLMMKLGVAPNLQGGLPMSLQSSTNMMNQNPLGSAIQLAKKVPEFTSETQPGYGSTTSEEFRSNSSSINAPFRSRTEEVLNSFLQNPILKEEGSGTNESAGRLQYENSMLRLVLKHQQIIEELMEENEKLRQILIEDLKISPSKLQTSHISRNMSPCTDCIECRRKQRRRR